MRVPIPMLTAERRTELAKLGGRYAEGARDRRSAACGATAWTRSRRFEKKHEIGEDESAGWIDTVQKLTDGYIKRIDEALAEKEREIKQV